MIDPVRMQITPVRVVIPGRPIPKSRPRFTRRGGVYSVKAQRVHEDAIGWALRAKLGHRRFHGPVRVYAVFFFPDRRTSDADNLLKLLLDAGNKIAWDDDKQVVGVTGEIEFDKANPRTEILIYLASKGAQ